MASGQICHVSITGRNDNRAVARYREERGKPKFRIICIVEYVYPLPIEGSISKKMEGTFPVVPFITATRLSPSLKIGSDAGRGAGVDKNDVGESVLVREKEERVESETSQIALFLQKIRNQLGLATASQPRDRNDLSSRLGRVDEMADKEVPFPIPWDVERRYFRGPLCEDLFPRTQAWNGFRVELLADMPNC